MSLSAVFGQSEIDSTQITPVDSAIVDTTQAQDTEFNRNSDISDTKNMMDEDVDYSATDSIVMLSDGTIVMYNNAKVKYGDIELEAYYIRMNQDSSMLFAEGVRDSNGVLTQSPIFKDGSETFDAEKIKYNFKSGKGLITNVSSEQAEGYVNGGVTKRIDENNLCMRHGRYTTCDNKDHPHFYLEMSRAKLKPGKSIVTGPSWLVVEGVKFPVPLPFAYFPFTDSYSSGFIMPSYGEETTRGFFLKGAGYYFALSDYMDLSLTADVYTLGSWALYGQSRYKKRYKFNGSFSMDYRVTVTGDIDIDDYSKSKDFSVRWTHSQDSKASAYSTFSASVNFSSSTYESNDLDRIYNTNNTNNHKSSSVSYSLRFPEAPFNISLSTNVSQNASDSTITATLPQLAVSMNRIYPFKRKTKVGADRWYEKIGVSYTGNLSNSYSGYQDDLFSSNIITDWSNGIKHSIPVSTSFQLFDNITISPSVSYTERWYSSSIEQSWDETNEEVLRDTVYGFNRVYDYSTSVSASTKLYGMYQPSQKIFGTKVQAIRHVMTPSVSMSWRPDFSEDKFGYYDSYTEYDSSDSTYNDVQYSKYNGYLYGTPGSGKSGTVGLSLGNNLEMKVRDDRDSTADFKKIKLLDRLNFSTGYNLMADSLNWSDVSVSLGVTVFKKSINVSSSFTPYSHDSDGNKINTFYKEDYGRLLRLTRASTSFGASIDQNKVNDFIKRLSGETPSESGSNSKGGADSSSKPDGGGGSSGKSGSQGKDGNKQKGTEFDENGYQKFSIPWSISLNYNVSVSSTWNSDIEEFEYEGNSNLSASGKVDLTSKWGLSVSSGYNFKTKEMASTRFTITRDLHCWSMSANLVPIGTYKSYMFSIHVNSAMLSDLKYEKRSSAYDTSIWD